MYKRPPTGHVTVPPEVFSGGSLITKEGYTLTSEDQLQLLSMPSKFEWAFCGGNTEALMSLLIDDIVIDHALGYAGNKAEMAKLSIPFFGLRHQMTNQVIFINADGNAAMISYLNAPQVLSERPVSVNLPAIYANCVVIDAFHRTDAGKWLFSKRQFDQLKLGDFVESRPEMVELLALPAETRGPQRKEAR